MTAVAYPNHMWLAGDGEGVIFVCEGPCRLPDEGLVIASYGSAALRHPRVPSFGLDQLADFMAFVASHGRSCGSGGAA